MQVSQPHPAETVDRMLQRLNPATNSDAQDRANAWYEWQTACEPVLLRFVQYHNGTREADEDVLQDALITAYVSLERGSYVPQVGVPFSAYVRGICRNKIREAARRTRHCTPFEELPEPREQPSSRRMEEALEAQQATCELLSGLQSLPAQRRAVLNGILAGQSNEQIAQALCISEPLVRQHKCRALRALREQFAQIDTIGLAV